MSTRGILPSSSGNEALPDLAAAFDLHKAGHLAEAAPIYQAILARDPDHSDALHLFGVVRHQQGDHGSAVELIGRAIALRPNVAAFHANLAEVYRALGQWERAAGCCRTALRLAPDYSEAMNNLGLALQGMGRHAEAADQFRHALQLRPDFAAVHNNLGLSLRELDRLDEALVHFQRAAELDPGWAPARTNFGQLLLALGRPEEALPHCQEAVRLQPDLAALHHNLGNAWRALERPVEARAAYMEALRLDPNLARSQAHLGLTLQQEGRLAEALPWLKQAVELAPKDPDLWERLADLHMERDEFTEAISCYERVLTLAPGRAWTHLSLGWALQEDYRLAEAKEHFQAALRLQPDSALAHLNMGGLHEEWGDLTEAEACFRTALRLRPEFANAHARLATLLRGRLPEADRFALNRRLADSNLGEEVRANLLFGLAHVQDARDEYPQAADSLRQANALALASADRRHRSYSPADHERFVDGVRSSFGQEFFARTAGGGLDTRRPVFIFGLPRSGTTLIEQVLASHSHVHGAGELRLARQSFEAIPAFVRRTEAPLEAVPFLDAESIRRLAGQHLQWLNQLDAGVSERVVDKMPDNYLYLGLIAAMFPRATLIHCRRDLRDVAVSCWMTNFRSIRWASSPEHLASRFQQYRRLLAHWREVLPLPLVEVDYEEAVDDLEGVARRLVAACALDWEPACLEFHRTRRPIRTASVTQVRQPIYQRSAGRWRNYERDLGGLFALLPRGEVFD